MILMVNLMPQSNHKKGQQGNVFIIILMGVILFGALGYTFSRSANKGTGNLTKQQAKIAAQEILNYARLVEGAVDRVRRNGCSESEISFDSNALSNYNNANSPVDNSCHIFKSEGGKISVLEIPNKWIVEKPSVNHKAYQEIYISSRHCVEDVGETGCTIPELTFMISYLKQNICDQINHSLGIDVELYDTNSFTLQNSNRADGTFVLGPQEEIDNDSDINGRFYMCVRTENSSANHPPNPGYTYIHVLLPRG